MDRVSFLSSMIGKPWQANAKGPEAFDCWHCVRYVKRVLFGEEIPSIEVPTEPTWRWMIEQFKEHDLKQSYKEIIQPVVGLLQAGDGALVLMARNSQPAHIGVLLQPERKILHCDQRDGVVFQDLMTIKTCGWAKLRYYERTPD